MLVSFPRTRSLQTGPTHLQAILIIYKGFNVYGETGLYLRFNAG